MRNEQSNNEATFIFDNTTTPRRASNDCLVSEHSLIPGSSHSPFFSPKEEAFRCFNCLLNSSSGGNKHRDYQFAKRIAKLPLDAPLTTNTISYPYNHRWNIWICKILPFTIYVSFSSRLSFHPFLMWWLNFDSTVRVTNLDFKISVDLRTQFVIL